MVGAPGSIGQRAAAAAKPFVRWTLGHVLPLLAIMRAARRGDLHGRLPVAPRGGDPFAVFDELRAPAPLFRGRFAFVAASLPVVREVLCSSGFAAGVDLSNGP